jgi:hypothetical protein
MVTVCAWCQKFLGLKEPLSQVDVSHGICPACSARQQVEDFPVLVVSRSRADTVPILQGLLGGAPEIKIVVDRRHNDRRRDRPPLDVPGGRRMLRDRRERISLVVT